MKIVVIGGTGHIGSYLIPILVAAGHQVTVISRGARSPYTDHNAWKNVRMVELNRKEADSTHTFGRIVQNLSPDIVIDLICYSPESICDLIEMLRGRITHLLVCGTIWIHGPSSCVPVGEENDRTPFGEYGTQKLAMECALLEETRRGGIPGTIIHPGHIVGPGWVPLNPEGHFDTEVFKNIWYGKEILLPDRGMETVHHVHAEDVARLFFSAMSHWSASRGEAFHAVSTGALTLRGYAEALYRWRGYEPAIRYLPWEEWKQKRTEKQILATSDHILHSPNCSMDKARHLLGYVPKWSSLDAIKSAIEWLAARDFSL
jgi:nucleoside-diphosphate-sugar epimerase